MSWSGRIPGAVREIAQTITGGFILINSTAPHPRDRDRGRCRRGRNGHTWALPRAMEAPSVGEAPGRAGKEGSATGALAIGAAAEAVGCEAWGGGGEDTAGGATTTGREWARHNRRWVRNRHRCFERGSRHRRRGTARRQCGWSRGRFGHRGWHRHLGRRGCRTRRKGCRGFRNRRGRLDRCCDHGGGCGRGGFEGRSLSLRGDFLLARDVLSVLDEYTDGNR